MTTTTPSRATKRIPYPLKARTLQVHSVTELSPTMRRIVLGGDELEETLPVPEMSVAGHVKVVCPDPTTGEILMPEITATGLKRPADIDLAMRTYTIRAFDPDACLLTLDFVLHQHGPAGRWAAQAQLGDQVGVLGPRASTIQPDGYSRYVIAADDTALPATERWLEEAPSNARLEVFILVDDTTSERKLPAHAGAQIHWLHRSAGAYLATAVIAAVPTDDGDTYVWAAAESESMKPLRTHLREVAKFEKQAIDIHGYWKAGVAGHKEPRH